METLNNILERKQEIRGLANPGASIKQRIADAAQSLSRAGNMALYVELANEVLTKYTLLLYERDADGVLPNIDQRTHRVRIPAPWGSAGWQKWEFRNWESRIMRGVMLDRVHDRKRPCLFDYNAESRTWHLNVTDYGVIETAQHYLNRSPITLAEWRKHDNAYRQRVQALRNK